MTPDEVVRHLQHQENNINFWLGDDRSQNKEYLEREKQLAFRLSLSSAISLIQDYQKLRERVSVGLKDIILSEMNKHAYRELVGERDAEDLSQSIVTYLRGENA
jgi:hypothetical protein